MPGPLVCPTCQQSYQQGEAFCAKDGSRLVESSDLPAQRDPREGEILAERFELKKCIGQGGMGVVYLARHRTLGRPYAIKLMLGELLRDERALARFFREARAASTVDHPNLISLHDYGTSERGEPYLVMEYAEGRTLTEVVSQSPARSLSPSRAVDIAVQVARALRHAHERGVVHRDIKPDNILVCELDLVPDCVKILDFGVAKIIGQPPLTYVGKELVGSPEYMAPEMWSGTDIGPPADLYALGILLHYLLVGAVPFDGAVQRLMWQHTQDVPQRLAQRRADLKIPEELEALTAKLLDKDPARRPDGVETVTRLEQVRALLPPRSLRGLLAAQTLILSQQNPLHSAPTVVLGLRGSQPGDAAQKATVLLPSLLVDIDQIEAEIDRSSSALQVAAAALGARRWSSSWPEEAMALKRRMDELEATEQQLGMHLALLDDRIEENKKSIRTRKDSIRRQVIDLSERLQRDRGLKASERKSLLHELSDKESSYWSAELSEQQADKVLVEKRDQSRVELTQRRGERLKGLMQLAQLLCSLTYPSSLRPLREKVDDLLSQLDAATAMLNVHLDRIAKSSR